MNALRRGTRLLSPLWSVGAQASATGAVTATARPEGQRRTIVNRTLLRLPEDYPEPWDYKEKSFTFTNSIFDRTMPRFTQNSKLIVIEGNIGAGKSTMAKELADQLGFYYMPEFKMDDILVDRYGNDLRNFYHLFPERFRIPDVNMFYKNPMSDLTAAMQDRIFTCRFDQYLNALAHIMNTGQGVVLERTPHTDFVFTNAMRDKNWISLPYFKHYYYVRKLAMPQLHFWPHLVIYLDTPVQKCLENIKKRGNPAEIAAVDEQYLSVIAESYKDSLNEFKKHSKILAYDWSKPGDADSIVEDIERMDFDFFEWHSGEIFEEWFLPQDEVSWGGWRMHVTNKFEARVAAFDNVKTSEVGELYINPRDQGHFIHTMKTKVLKSPYGYGYNEHLGDEKTGMGAHILGNTLPERWYEYYFKEAYYEDMASMESGLDPWALSYDPDYVHAHH
ncbi:hypothetical protein L596_025449 [Steinernema carpocapsae]|uniref:NADH dehydrogenase [ubiquinone] 1 alpha subcomplex subunit 10, mitochondrial n=1 Tax=Steinernema carpocapsae TaxID=34508 RepID=A0A4U5M7V8_STECR|nr:hypothetical protein L596_025449 [Steinernema carpocapsae]